MYLILFGHLKAPQETYVTETSRELSGEFMLQWKYKSFLLSPQKSAVFQLGLLFGPRAYEGPGVVCYSTPADTDNLRFLHKPENMLRKLRSHVVWSAYVRWLRCPNRLTYTYLAFAEVKLCKCT